jgi:CDP-diacylglycerol--glycerol-3-phosphate 3-phosphatidyltransferase
MPTLYDIKPRFQALLRPAVRRLAAAGVSANQVTIAALVMSIAHGAWIASGSAVTVALALLPLTLFARMALNAVDGMLAREHDQKTRLGAILNECGDGIADAALYLPFALLPGVPPQLAVALVVLALIGEMVGIAAAAAGGTRRYDGPLGKSDRALVHGLIALAMLGGWWSAAVGAWVYPLLVVLAAVTVINRLRAAAREAA